MKYQHITFYYRTFIEKILGKKGMILFAPNTLFLEIFNFLIIRRVRGYISLDAISCQNRWVLHCFIEQVMSDEWIFSIAKNQLFPFVRF